MNPDIMHLLNFSKFKKKRKDRQENWDSICLKCGQCCYEKDIRRGKVITDYSAPCEFLDVKTGKCSVYNCRFKKSKDCQKMNLFRALFARYIPDTCNYVIKYRFWRRPGRN